MKKFILLYHAPKGMMDMAAQVSPEEAKKGMESWMEWAKKCGSGMVDLGTPLGNAHKVTKTDHGTSESTVVGYSVLQAESWEKLQEMVMEHPHLQWGEGCEVEVHECLPLPGTE